MPFGVRELGTALVVPCLTRYFPEARAFRNLSPYLRKDETADGGRSLSMPR
jgi:hypothetical protein